jgi:hypothetical protein
MQVTHQPTPIPVLLVPSGSTSTTITLVMSDIPGYYAANSHLSLLIDGSEVSAYIVTAFTPSISQVFVVRIDGDIPCPSLSSGSLAILKVYDPRFHPERRKRIRHPLPWTYENEAAAAEQRRAHPMTSRFELADRPRNSDPVAWEDYHYLCTELAASSELEAYQRLTPLQGTAVPVCYTSGTLNPSGLNTTRAIVPPILLLEYIPDAKTIKDIDPRVIAPSLIQSVFQTVTAFGALGVAHNDLHAHNILFAPGDHPVRAVIIDFGSAYVHEDESDEEWKEIVARTGDLLELRAQFRWKLPQEDVSQYLSEVPTYSW